MKEELKMISMPFRVQFHFVVGYFAQQGSDYWRESMRIELTFPDRSRETADLKSGTGTSTVTSPLS